MAEINEQESINKPDAIQVVDNVSTEVVDKISTDDYIKSTIEAGNRVRGLIYILSFASIISLISFWNAYDKSWINDRFNTIYEIDEHYGTDGARHLPAPCKNYKADSARILAFLNFHEINTIGKLEAYKKIYTDLKKNTYTVQVPILGIGFDINDLGVFCGVTFAFLFVLLLLAIGREHDNLIIAFDYSQKHSIIGKVYYYLAMGQMLADPPTPPYEKYTPNWVRKHIVKGLFMIPLLCHGTILVNDFFSFDAAKDLNLSSGYGSISISCILFLVNVSIAIACILKEREMDDLWIEYCQKVPSDEVQKSLSTGS